MRVLLVNTYHYLRGGDSSYTFALAELLRSQGHDVYFFSMKHPNNVPCGEEKYFVDYIDYGEMNVQKNFVNAARVLSRSIYSRQARANIARLLDDVKPEIAHLQNIHVHLTPSILFELEKRAIPVFWTLHDYKLICPNTHLLSHGEICEACHGGKYWQCTIRKCKKNSRSASMVATMEALVHGYLKFKDKVRLFISPSRFLFKKFTEFGWQPEHLVHIRNFLPRSAFSATDSHDEKYVLYLGQLEPWKGVSSLLQASALLKDCRVVIVGQGTQREELGRKAVEYGAASVEFRGYLSGEALREVVRKCSLVVVPSEWYENCPYSVMESMAEGKAVIASTIGGLPELVEDRVTGLLFEPGNHKELAEKMELLMDDATLRKRMGVNAREKAMSEFSESGHYGSLMNLYSKSAPTGRSNISTA